MPTITKKEIQKLVATNRLPLLFEILSDLSELSVNKTLGNEIIVIQAKYTKLKETVRAGTIRYEDEAITESQIINSLAEIVNYLPDRSYEISDPLFVKLKKRAKSGIYKLGGIIILSFVLVASFVVYFNRQEPVIEHTKTHTKISKDTTAPLPDTPQTQQFVNTMKKVKQVAALQILSPRPFPGNNSKVVINTDTFQLAYMDLAYMPGREQEANYAEDACCYQFELKNPNLESITIQSLFVELYAYKPLPNDLEIITNQPFDEATMVYILMGSNARLGANVYRNSFYVIDDKRKNWGRIKLESKSSDILVARINAKQPGIYSFQLGIEYYSERNDSIVRKFILPKKTTWVFKNGPE